MMLLEGMSAGLPVVASRLRAFELLLRDGVDGLIVHRADDNRGFADALNLLLDRPDLRTSMGRAGRQRALDTFAWPVVVDRLEDLYREVAKRKSTTTRERVVA